MSRRQDRGNEREEEQKEEEERRCETWEMAHVITEVRHPSQVSKGPWNAGHNSVQVSESWRLKEQFLCVV